jgi:hypothetical protein
VPRELSDFFEPFVNELQIEKLGREEVEKLLSLTSEIRESLSYD